MPVLKRMKVFIESDYISIFMFMNIVAWGISQFIVKERYSAIKSLRHLHKHLLFLRLQALVLIHAV